MVAVWCRALPADEGRDFQYIQVRHHGLPGMGALGPIPKTQFRDIIIVVNYKIDNKR